LTILAQEQETQNSSFTVAFDDSVVAYSNGFSNISDVISALDELNTFDPLSAVLNAAEQNVVEAGVNVIVKNGDMTLLSIAVSDLSLMADIVPSYLIAEENMKQIDGGYTFVDKNEDIEFNVIVDPALGFTDLVALLDSDII